jgi:hypothetical protein
MPLPPHVISVTAFLCEKVLTEPDGVMSAIRIVDLFSVPETSPGVRPQIRFYGCVLFKSMPGRYEHVVQMRILQVDGTTRILGDETVVMASSSGKDDIPGGVNIQAEFNIVVQQPGTCYLSVFLDGEEVTRLPFTVRLQETAKDEPKG